MGTFFVPSRAAKFSATSDPKELFRLQTQFNNAVCQNLLKLATGQIDGGDITKGTITPANLIQAAAITSVIYVGSQNGAPVFRQDPTFLSYDDTVHRLTLGANPILKAMALGDVPFVTTGGLLATDPAKLSFDDSNGIFKVNGVVRVGTTTDGSTSGDFSAGLAGAAYRMKYIQANGRMSLLDNAANEKIRISTSEDSYIAANFLLGVGTATPRRALDVSAALNQMRLTNTDNAIYADFSVDASGNLTVSPTGKLTKLAQGGNGQQVVFGEETELTTIAAAATTDTVIQIPVNAVVLGVSVRVTVAIPTAATFTVTGTTSATQFDVAGGVAVAANTTDIGTRNCPFKNGATQTIRITPNINPATNVGRVRVTIQYYTITPPTS